MEQSVIRGCSKSQKIPGLRFTPSGLRYAKHERPGRIFWVTFFVRAKTNSSGMNLCCEADPKGKSQGCDLQRNSLQQERNKMLVNTDY